MKSLTPSSAMHRESIGITKREYIKIIYKNKIYIQDILLLSLKISTNNWLID